MCQAMRAISRCSHQATRAEESSDSCGIWAESSGSDSEGVKLQITHATLPWLHLGDVVFLPLPDRACGSRDRIAARQARQCSQIAAAAAEGRI
jgi:hypothetical protein